MKCKILNGLNLIYKKILCSSRSVGITGWNELRTVLQEESGNYLRADVLVFNEKTIILSSSFFVPQRNAYVQSQRYCQLPATCYSAVGRLPSSGRDESMLCRCAISTAPLHSGALAAQSKSDTTDYMYRSELLSKIRWIEVQRNVQITRYFLGTLFRHFTMLYQML
jgi:hypothetical protein